MCKEYIEREAAIANSREYNLGGSYENTERAVPVDAINSIPAADVRPVVLCKECVHRHDRNRQSCQGRRPDFFCADGERITNGFNIADKNEKLSATMNIMEES